MSSNETSTTRLAWPDVRITSWAELQEIIDPLAGGCVFRGQGSMDWPLLPSFNRVVPVTDELHALRLETEAILRFRCDGHSFIPPSVLPPNAISLKALDTYVEWLMLMQHYGAPTRLLDWSDSPYVALYFAVIDGSDHDCALWYFSSIPIRTAVLAHFGRNPGEFLDYGEFSADEIRRPSDAPLVFCAQKKQRSMREVAQQGVFTFSNRIGADQQDAIARSCGNAPFGRVIIPHECKMEFSYRLSLMNVTAATLFPGLEGVSTSIRDWLRLAAASGPNPPEPSPPAPMAEPA